MAPLVPGGYAIEKVSGLSRSESELFRAQAGSIPPAKYYQFFINIEGRVASSYPIVASSCSCEEWDVTDVFGWALADVLFDTRLIAESLAVDTPVEALDTRPS